jgi:aryl-alcohol dehydrogenase-like predicted oxidoreductase
MEYRYLGRTAIQVSLIGMGCLQFGGKAGLAETVEIVARCLDLGINFFDTANTYSDGLSEEYLGKALGSRRQQTVLATKVGRVRLGQRRKMARDSSPAEIRSAIEGSLRRLNTDYIDLYQIHASRLCQLDENGCLDGWALSPGQVQELDRILATAGQV